MKCSAILTGQRSTWEYVQFLNNAVCDRNNNCTSSPYGVTPFLADEGKNFLDAWVNADSTYGALGPMVPPYPMATAAWNNGDCIPEPEICYDGSDNDCDELVDCNDPDCDDDPAACPDLIEYPFCFDGLDNDFDTLIDCADTADCQGVTEASTCGLGVCFSTGTKTCLANGTLEDTCTPLPATEPGMEMTCDNGLDDDFDGLTDMNDPDCMACSEYMDKGTCNIDPNCEWVGNPKNGMCQDAVVCQPTGPEVGNCADGIDNNCDGMTDCADPVCMMPCDTYSDKMSCQNAGCSWSNKDKMCM